MDSLQKLAVRLIGDQRQDITLEVDEENISEVLDVLHERRGRLLSLIPKKETLEEVFLKEVVKESENNTDNSNTILP